MLCKNIFYALDPYSCIFLHLHHLLCSKPTKNLRIHLLSNFYYKCVNLLRFCIFPSLQPSSQLVLVQPNSLLFSPLPAECHLKTFPLRFHPCKLGALLVSVFSKVHEFVQNSVFSPRLERFVIFALGAPIFSDFQQSTRICRKQRFQPEISTFCHVRTGRTTYYQFLAKCRGLYKTVFSARD